MKYLSSLALFFLINLSVSAHTNVGLSPRNPAVCSDDQSISSVVRANAMRVNFVKERGDVIEVELLSSFFRCSDNRWRVINNSSDYTYTVKGRGHNRGVESLVEVLDTQATNTRVRLTIPKYNLRAVNKFKMKVRRSIWGSYNWELTLTNGHKGYKANINLIK